MTTDIKKIVQHKETYKISKKKKSNLLKFCFEPNKKLVRCFLELSIKKISTQNLLVVNL